MTRGYLAEDVVSEGLARVVPWRDGKAVSLAVSGDNRPTAGLRDASARGISRRGPAVLVIQVVAQLVVTSCLPAWRRNVVRPPVKQTAGNDDVDMASIAVVAMEDGQVRELIAAEVRERQALPALQRVADLIVRRLI